MKNNKGITIGLLIAVLVIWGVIFYRLYSSFFSEREEVLSLNSPLRKEVSLNEKKEFSIAANYRDPFFGKMMLNNPVKVSGATNKTQVKTPPMDWSFINYFGLIKNKDNNKGVALMSISDKDYMISEGLLIEDVKILKILKDSVKVSYQGKTTYLKKK